MNSCVYALVRMILYNGGTVLGVNGSIEGLMLGNVSSARIHTLLQYRLQSYAKSVANVDFSVRRTALVRRARVDARRGRVPGYEKNGTAGRYVLFGGSKFGKIQRRSAHNHRRI
jgi:hypothetical protein